MLSMLTVSPVLMSSVNTTDKINRKAEIDLFQYKISYQLIQLKLKKTKFVFKEKRRRISRKRKLHIKHIVCKRKKFNKKEKQTKVCLNKLKYIKEQRILTNTFHN